MFFYVFAFQELLIRQDVTGLRQEDDGSSLTDKLVAIASASAQSAKLLKRVFLVIVFVIVIVLGIVFNF